MLAVVVDAVTDESSVATAVPVFPLFVIGVITPPARLIVSPSLYVNVVGGVVTEILATGSVTVKSIVAVFSWYVNVNVLLSTSAFVLFTDRFPLDNSFAMFNV